MRLPISYWLSLLGLACVVMPAAATDADKLINIANPASISATYGAGDEFMGIRLLGTVEIDDIVLELGRNLNELSGLAWDNDEQILYAISDNGVLAHLRPTIVDGHLTDVEFLRYVNLKDSDNQRLRNDLADSEGLAIENGNDGIKGNTTLIISFERQPRIGRFDTQGTLLKRIDLPPPLNELKNYKNSNKGLEAVVLHPRIGIMTGPEKPLRIGPQDLFDLFDLKGHSWSFPLYHPNDSALVSVENLPDGDLLIMQRNYRYLMYPPSIVLQRASFKNASEKGQPLATENIAVFDNAENWRIDNFEGLSHHEGWRYFMVSDNNELRLQRTLLVYFEVLH